MVRSKVLGVRPRPAPDLASTAAVENNDRSTLARRTLGAAGSDADRLLADLSGLDRDMELLAEALAEALAENAELRQRSAAYRLTLEVLVAEVDRAAALHETALRARAAALLQDAAQRARQVLGLQPLPARQPSAGRRESSRPNAAPARATWNRASAIVLGDGRGVVLERAVAASD